MAPRSPGVTRHDSQDTSVVWGGLGHSSPRTLRLAEDEADPMSFTAMHV